MSDAAQPVPFCWAYRLMAVLAGFGGGGEIFGDLSQGLRGTFVVVNRTAEGIGNPLFFASNDNALGVNAEAAQEGGVAVGHGNEELHSGQVKVANVSRAMVAEVNAIVAHAGDGMGAGWIAVAGSNPRRDDAKIHKAALVKGAVEKPFQHRAAAGVSGTDGGD